MRNCGEVPARATRPRVWPSPGRGARSLPVGRSLAPREAQRSEGTRRAIEAASGRVARRCVSRSRASEADVLVGAAGIEPATTCSQSRYATAALRPEGGELSHAGAGTRALARIIHERLQPSRGSFPPDTSSDLLCDAPGIAVVGLPRPDEKSLAGTRCTSATRNIGAPTHSSLNEMHVFRLGVRELSGLGRSEPLGAFPAYVPVRWRP